MSKYTEIARRYAKSVIDGDTLACKWVKKACQRQMDDLERFKGRSSPYRFNPLLTDTNGRKYRPADNLCAFVELLPHIKGPLAGQPISLEPWQIFVLTTVFGWVRKDGRRRFRRAYIEVPRGNAKSTLSSAVGLVLPELDGKLDGYAIRVPTINVSVVDLTFVAARATTVDEVNDILEAAANGPLKGILAYTNEPLVSVDFNHTAVSSTVDAGLTKVSEGTLVKVGSWYDNEWGFSNRMLDTTVALMAAK